MQIFGKVIGREEMRQGTSQSGKTWKSQTYIVLVEENSRHPKHIALTFLGDRVDEATQKLSKDTYATFDFDVDAREYNGKWYNSVNCCKFTLQEQPSTQQQVEIPTPQQPAPQPIPQQSDGQSYFDSLPF